MKTRYTNKNYKTKTRKQIVTHKEKRLEDDFYSYINNGWEHHHKIPNDESSTNLFVLLQNKVDNELKNKVLEAIFKEKTRNASNVKNIYKSSVKWNDDIVEKKINEDVFELNRICKDDGNLYKFLVWFSKKGYSSLITWKVIIDFKNSQRYISSIQEDGLSFYSKSFYFKNDMNNINKRKHYLDFIDRVFFEIFGTNYDNISNKIFEIEKNISNYILDEDEELDTEKIINVYDIHECKDEFSFDWNEYAKELGFKNVPKKINIENKRHLKYAMHILKKWNECDIKMYWIYQILLTSTNHHSKLNALKFDFFSKYINGVIKDHTLEKKALYKLEIIMNATISKKYIEIFKNENEKKLCLILLDILKRTFRKRLLKNKWLHKNSIERAVKKLDNIKFIIGYKNKWHKDPDCDFLPNDSLGNNQKYIEWDINENVKKYYNKIEYDEYWDKDIYQNVFDVNAYYYDSNNLMIIPNAFLQAPFIDVNKNMAYNLASMGTTIGHEITHAFDDEGCQYDENGNYNNWWVPEDIRNYKAKQKKIVELYEIAAKRDNLVIKGEISLGENISDIGGFLIAEEAFADYLNENNMGLHEQIQSFKEFYTYYAEQWRFKIRQKRIKTFVADETHALSKYRCNCVLSTSSRFKEIYNIQKEDGMYFSDIEPIW
jgi:putative endopeptidase